MYSNDASVRVCACIRHTHTHTHTHTYTHTHTHTHTHTEGGKERRERDRKRERGREGKLRGRNFRVPVYLIDVIFHPIGLSSRVRIIAHFNKAEGWSLSPSLPLSPSLSLPLPLSLRASLPSLPSSVNDYTRQFQWSKFRA